jgi:hypothetical protein
MTTIAERTTGIGSLPHHNVDAALDCAFRTGIPFLPQIPIRNPWEFMIAQALEGLPGLQADSNGTARLNVDIWLSRASDFGVRLDSALARAPGVLIPEFEPNPSTSSCWQPFVWELAERGAKKAKIQIAGPITAQGALLLSDPDARDQHPELERQIFRLVLARALAMSRRLLANGIQPLLFIDEPGLYGLTPAQPRHMVALQELKLVIQALRKEGVQVGLHCCSNTAWEAILKLPLDYLSIDAGLSLESVLSHPSEFESFLKTGRLALGVVPAESPRLPFQGMGSTLSSFPAEKTRQILEAALYTPACGLALHSVEDAEATLATLLSYEPSATPPRGARA